ncbi:MAG TPA: aminomethyltransferase family protein [Pyrinomonadaceae bacterium]|nr:aminomethyltransferase family protein [Pyrinomonadaceae bacterium]
MSEAVEQQQSTPNDVGRKLPSSYGNPGAEYAAVRSGGAGLLDLSGRGRVRVSGSEAISFLNGLITNDMKTLDEGRWMPAIFPNVQGRFIASVRVMRLRNEKGDKGDVPNFLLDTEPETHNQLLKSIERFTLAGDFHVSDLTIDTTHFSVQGRNSIECLRDLGVPGEIHQGRSVATVTLNGSNLTLVHSTHTGEDGYDLIIDKSQGPSVWEMLVARGAKPVGSDALETLRIEAGIPRYSVDIDESMVVSETNLDEAVSFTKGCYVGQEIIARIRYRGHVAKKLTGLVLDERREIPRGTRLTSADGKEVGNVTSSTFSPALERTIGLALIRYQFMSPGTRLALETGDNKVHSTVAALPFVSASWQIDT